MFQAIIFTLLVTMQIISWTTWYIFWQRYHSVTTFHIYIIIILICLVFCGDGRHCFAIHNLYKCMLAMLFIAAAFLNTLSKPRLLFLSLIEELFISSTCTFGILDAAAAKLAASFTKFFRELTFCHTNHLVEPPIPSTGPFPSDVAK